MPVTIRDLMQDPQLFGDQFAGASWAPWRALLAGFYGLDLDHDERKLWRALTGRRSAPEAPHNELWLVVGRRGGKSNMAALLAVYEAVFRDHRAKLAPGEVATVMVLAADRKQSRSVMRYISGLLHANPMLERLIVREDTESIELTNRCTIETHTASFRAVRGYSVACCICDEISFWRAEDSANPDREILNALRPAMATLDGKLIALSSPYARRGELWNNYRDHYAKDLDQILVAQAPSLTMNPSLPTRVVDSALERDPASASAEYLAQFRTDVERFISLEAVESCTRPKPMELPPQAGVRYVGFTDPSGGAADSFTLAIGHADGETAVIDVVRAVKPPFSPEQVVREFAALLKLYRINKVIGDAYAGEWPREQFRKNGIRYEKSERNRSQIYTDMLPLLNSGRVELPPLARLSTELVSLERRTTRGGRDSIDHPTGGHDDIANAAAGAAVNVSKHKREIPRVKITFAY